MSSFGGSEGSRAKDALLIIQQILEAMKIDAVAKLIEEKEGEIRVDLQGRDLGRLIGKRGQTLLSLQYLTNIILNKPIDKPSARVILDAQGYRARREATLRSMALRTAQEVKEKKKKIALESLPAHERRIIHLTLRDDPDIITYSEGEGEERKLIVSLRKEKETEPSPK